MGFEIAGEKLGISVKVKILSSNHSFEDPAQVLRTYPGSR
jgi:hypothetical protein